MPRTIVKLSDEEQIWYLDWSSVVDAPLTFGMSLEDFKEYYIEEYGKNSKQTLSERLARVEKHGTSAIGHDSVEKFIEANRAGKNDTSLTLEQIVLYYCKLQDLSQLPSGTPLDDENATE